MDGIERLATNMLKGVAVLLSDAIQAACSLKNLDEVKRMRAARRSRPPKKRSPLSPACKA
jgi:hypothetical protein